MVVVVGLQTVPRLWPNYSRDMTAGDRPQVHAWREWDRKRKVKTQLSAVKDQNKECAQPTYLNCCGVHGLQVGYIGLCCHWQKPAKSQGKILATLMHAYIIT